MRITGVTFESVRATPAAAEFVLRVGLDGPAAGCAVEGVATGPKCPGVTTVEVAYRMAVGEVGDTAVSLRCVIPEPNLWSPGAPFTYDWAVTAGAGGEVTDRRAGAVALRAAG